ncbi:hypothetical protein LPJ81_006799, partial [Coemansia sp. IMI 209127]
MEPSDDSDPSVDRMFVSGDCADHSIIKVSEHQTGSAGALAMPALGQQITPVLENHCPVTSLILHRDKAFWTSGRATTGSVQQAQFGHIVQTETALDMRIDEGQQNGSHVATRVWAISNIVATCGNGEPVCANKKQRTNKQSPHVVLHNECSGISVVESELGDWQIDDSLQHVVSDPDLVL